MSLGGGLHVNADLHVHVDTARAILADLDFGWGFDFRFAQPPPPRHAPCDYQCDAAVPSHHVANTVFVEPVYVAPVYVAPVYVDQGPMARARRFRSRWGLGAFAGTMNPDGMESGSDLGILGQYRFSRSIALELEAAKSKLADGGRVDRRLGVAILYNLAPRRSLAPFLLVGAGYGQTEIAGGEFHAEQGYAELGAGLRLRLSSSFQVIADLRAGQRDSKEDYAYMSSSPSSTVSLQEDENYTRLRGGGLVTF